MDSFHQAKSALKKIEITAKEKNFCSGYHVVDPEPDLVGKKIDEGYKFVGFSLDALFLGLKCKEEFEKIGKRRKN